MKKSILLTAVLTFLFAAQMTAQQQEPQQKKKEKAKKECQVNGKKCCADTETSAKTSEATTNKRGHCDAKKEE
jgi:Ni/Co efflux regulator RcnB